MLICHVTLWPWPLTCWPWKFVVDLVSCGKFHRNRTNPTEFKSNQIIYLPEWEQNSTSRTQRLRNNSNKCPKSTKVHSTKVHTSSSAVADQPRCTVGQFWVGGGVGETRYSAANLVGARQEASQHGLNHKTAANWFSAVFHYCWTATPGVNFANNSMYDFR